MEKDNKGVNSSASPTGEGVNPAPPTGTPGPAGSEAVETPEPQPEPKREVKVEGNPPAPAPVPYSRFKDVVDKKKELEDKVRELEESLSSSDLSQKYPDWEMLDETQKAIIQKQEAQEKELKEMKAEKQWEGNLSKAMAEFPELKESADEFKDYCRENPQAGMATLAKSFLYDKKPVRRGLEAPTGGDKTAPSGGFTVDDVRRIRETDPKLFAKLVQEGRIDVKKLK